MKRRILTLAIVVLFALTLIPLIAVADENLIKLDKPAGVDAPDSHWGWSSRIGIDTLPRNMRGITGIRIEFDFEPGQAEFVVQSPYNWWDHPGATAFTGNTLEIVFADFTDEWGDHNKQYEMHIVFGNWDASITPDNIVNAWLIGEELGAPQFGPGDEDPVLAPPTVDDFGGHDHWGWSMENGSLPWNMSEITGIVIEFDEDSGSADFIVQSPANWWEQGAFPFTGGKLELTFADAFAEWGDHIQQDMMHLVFGNWGSLRPSNVISAKLIGTVADGIPSPGAAAVVELPPEGTLPYDMGTGHPIWGDTFTQTGWDSDLRARDEKTPFAGPGESGGLTAPLLYEAKWMVIYVDNAPDDEIAEMLQLTIFGNANGWGWTAGTMEAPTVQIYDTFVPGAIAFPISGHPYIDDINQSDLDLEAVNFGICFQYTGGIENLGITGVWLYADLPEVAATPEPPPAATPAPATPAPTPTPAAEPTSSGFPVWGIVVLIVGGAAVVAVVVVTVIKKKKA